MRFKYYNQQQAMLLPYWFDDLIPEKHPGRIVDHVVESINIEPLLNPKVTEASSATTTLKGINNEQGNYC